MANYRAKNGGLTNLSEKGCLRSSAPQPRVRVPKQLIPSHALIGEQHESVLHHQAKQQIQIAYLIRHVRLIEQNKEYHMAQPSKRQVHITGETEAVLPMVLRVTKTMDHRPKRSMFEWGHGLVSNKTDSLSL